MNTKSRVEFKSFVCPKCKGALEYNNHNLICNKCKIEYPINKDIPDFIISGLASKNGAFKKIIKFMDIVAPIYESKFWQNLNLKLANAKNASLSTIFNFHSQSLKGINGNIIDIACGTATYGRRMNKPERNVYGIDISLGALKKGRKFIIKENINQVILARASVEELPFPNEYFNGSICSGSLHLFPNTVVALREIARVLRKNAVLTIQTFIDGDTIVNKSLKRQKWVQCFTIEKLKKALTESGFNNFNYHLEGPIVILFNAKKI